ncbi:hypothetical protein ASC82_25055 [Streptomyces sp. Root431]|uniref:hypothetical protein n=1 Tax=Streptomyces sp. Root431 TaxID=1736535 RepID=UPI0006FCDE8F|nr:hypothetical protein [Streptomyces sp. Root431]KQX09219.1 hypothetical protein ASC82_25055 [Streptomyces sp. Root431]
MPRGRHRHSPPLHKLLPPSAVAGAAVVCAAVVWLPGDLLVVRLLAVVAAAAAVTGAVLMRSWDRSAGAKVAELSRARTADQWKAEERVAELESDLEESRGLRTRLDAKLRAKRVELAALRGEHADLLRRYATAETERASALEGRRVLALEATGAAGGATGAEAKALPAAGSTPTPEAYRKAAQALRDLPRNAAAQHARRTAEAARARDLAERARETEEPQGKHAAAAGTEQHSRTAAPALGPSPAQAALPAAPAPSDAEASAPAAPAVPVPPTGIAPLPAVQAAAAIVPYAARRPVPRPEGGFDFFGAQKVAAAIEAVQNTDLADVVGEEVLEEALAAETPFLVPLAPLPTPAPVPPRAIGEVIDLTAHDETEQIDVAELRGAVSQ